MSTFRTYEEAVDYLRSFTDYEKMVRGPAYPADFSLARMDDLLEQVGWPNRGLDAIHIAGTKGKSSTSFMASAILTATGLLTGLFTSPHLIDREERIRIDLEPITRAALLDLMNKLGPHLIALRDKGVPPTFFDIITTAAFIEFQRRRVDASVFEVGLGGRLDSTNVLAPLVCAITPIGLDHTEKLGHDIVSIAGEKAGIIKPGVPVISHPQERDAMDVVESRCADLDARLILIGRDIQIIGAEWPNEPFDVVTGRSRYEGLTLKLLGSHQRVNAASAIACAELFLEMSGSGPLEHEAVRATLQDLVIPGRTQMVGTRPRVLVDGAHNVMAFQSLTETIARSVDYERMIVIFACSRDKDIDGILRTMAPLAHQWVLSKVDFPRTATPEEIAGKVNAVCGQDPLICEWPEDALDKALSMAGPDDLICCCGSFYLAGEIMKLLPGCD